MRILLGCDGIFDRPLIVAEGFDIGQNVSLDDLEAEYYASLAPFRSAGYDLVLLDYWDARLYLQSNANVLIELINEVNRTKVGNFPLVVLGESMSGLIARFALRTMENNGLPHHVGHFISFDSPQQGANLPVGLLELYWNASRGATILSLAAALLINPVRQYFLALQTPAAAQLLRHYGGPFGPGAPHPEFVAFQQTLQNLGYPQQCTNLSVISGSPSASDVITRTENAPGDLIMNSFTPYILQNTFIQVRTNNPGNNTVVLDFVARGLALNHASVTLYNSSLNDDFLPGGYVEVPYNIDRARSDFLSSFVPTFSSIDFQGPRNEQGQRQNLNVQTARANLRFLKFSVHLEIEIALMQLLDLLTGILLPRMSQPGMEPH